MHKKKIVLFSAILAMCLLGGCGQKASTAPDATNDKVAEATNEAGKVQDTSVEENSVADTIVESETDPEEEEQEATEASLSELSNEEWVKSLNLEEGTFILFNESTGERRVLEEGSDYTLLEGDEIGFWYPLDWKKDEWKFGSLLWIMDYKYECLTMNFDINETIDNKKIEMALFDTEGNPRSYSLYLSK